MKYLNIWDFFFNCQGSNNPPLQKPYKGCFPDEKNSLLLASFVLKIPHSNKKNSPCFGKHLNKIKNAAINNYLGYFFHYV